MGFLPFVYVLPRFLLALFVIRLWAVGRAVKGDGGGTVRDRGRRRRTGGIVVAVKMVTVMLIVTVFITCSC